MSICYLGVCDRGAKRRVKAALLKNPDVQILTDHGHLKVIASKALPPIRGFYAVRVRDRTTHWDVTYWRFAMEIVRHATRKNQDGTRVVGVLVHYLCNLASLPEAELLRALAANRELIDAAVSDEDAHGWELPYIKKLRKEHAL